MKAKLYPLIVIVISVLITPFFYATREYAPEGCNSLLEAFSMANLTLACVLILVYVIMLILSKLNKITDKNILNIQKVSLLMCLLVFLSGFCTYGDNFSIVGLLQIILLYILVFCDEDFEEKAKKFGLIAKCYIIPLLIIFLVLLLPFYSIINEIVGIFFLLERGIIASLVMAIIMCFVLRKKQIKYKCLLFIVCVISMIINSHVVVSGFMSV